MKMKEYLTKLITDKQAQRKKLNESLIECDNKEERTSIVSTMSKLDEEIREANAQLKNVEEVENKEVADEARNAFDPAKALNVVGTAAQNVGKDAARNNEDERASMEYRTAFMNYVQRGVKSDVLKFEQRADAYGTASDLGVLLPSTVVQAIIEGVEKIYGQLYSRVRKTNIKGGVKYPIGSFSATFNRISETGKSDRQDAGSITGYVEFSYNIGEIRVAQTLLQTVLAVPVFENKLVEVILKAYVKAMDNEIINGVAANSQCEGILTEAAKASSRIPTANIISFTDTEMADWTKWQEKLFAKIPLSMRSLRPQFVMTANTYEANIKTLKDNNNRPLYNETFNPVDGSEVCTFKGKEVVLVEDDIFENFDDAANDEYFGMYWVPEEAYAINSNMEFTMIRYFDQETNQYVDKALVINDGKVLDPKYIYLLKKSVTA